MTSHFITSPTSLAAKWILSPLHISAFPCASVRCPNLFGILLSKELRKRFLGKQGIYPWVAKSLWFNPHLTTSLSTTCRFSNAPLLSSSASRSFSLQRDVVCQGCDNSKKFRLVNWNTICTPKDSGELGIRPLRIMNQAFLGNWLWRLGEDSEGLWRSILLAKYNGRRNCWDISHPSQRCFSFWIKICSTKDAFAHSIHYCIRKGRKISFWNDVWPVSSSSAPVSGRL